LLTEALVVVDLSIILRIAAHAIVKKRTVAGLTRTVTGMTIQDFFKISLFTEAFIVPDFSIK
jgi:hypothetical protein